MSARLAELERLLGRLTASADVTGERSREIASIEVDSRAVRPGALFVALRGERTDGHRYLEEAIRNGAAAIVIEQNEPVPAGASTVVRVPDSRRALSALSSAFFDDPSQAIDVVGVTGTNGKTTTTRMIAAMMNAGGRPCGVIGTVGAHFGDRTWELANTTPLPHELHALLAEMRDLGARAVAMEVSSHALALDRVEDVRFRVAALTNVTRDHLDFHQTIEAYAAAKHRLFTMADSCVFNVDDEYGLRWAAEFSNRLPTRTYGLRARADIGASMVRMTGSGTTFFADGHAFRVMLPGRFNISNALCALGVTRSLGIDDEPAARGLASLERVAGRMEHVGSSDVDVVVDYAHTPDALAEALRALRETTGGNLTVVFGCGGDRDRGKRVQMGAIAASIADRLYITNDNPRTEDPAAIAREIARGAGEGRSIVELDRGAAIARAIAEAAPGDVILVAGKGHEHYQIVGAETRPFDDVSVARAALETRGAPT